MSVLQDEKRSEPPVSHDSGGFVGTGIIEPELSMQQAPLFVGQSIQP